MACSDAFRPAEEVDPDQDGRREEDRETQDQQHGERHEPACPRGMPPADNARHYCCDDQNPYHNHVERGERKQGSHM
jgi:hypothetical protein